MVAFTHAFEPLAWTPDDVPLRLGVGLVRGQDGGEQSLSARERRRHAGFPVLARRDSFVLGRQAAKLALRAYGGDADLREIEIANDLLGAPYCERLPVNVTLSHCGEVAIALASHRAVRIGVDLEALDAFHALTDRWFDDGEIDLLARSPVTAEMSMDLRRGLLWVSKEALGKALGTGLAVDWAMLSVARIDRAPVGWTVAFRNVSQFKADIWRVGSLMVACASPSTITLSSPAMWLERLTSGLSGTYAPMAVLN